MWHDILLTIIQTLIQIIHYGNHKVIFHSTINVLLYWLKGEYMYEWSICHIPWSFLWSISIYSQNLSDLKIKKDTVLGLVLLQSFAYSAFLFYIWKLLLAANQIWACQRTPQVKGLFWQVASEDVQQDHFCASRSDKQS